MFIVKLIEKRTIKVITNIDVDTTYCSDANPVDMYESGAYLVYKVLPSYKNEEVITDVKIMGIFRTQEKAQALVDNMSKYVSGELKIDEIETDF